MNDQSKNKLVGVLNKKRERLGLVTLQKPKLTMYAIGGYGGNGNGFLSSVEEWEESTMTWKMTNVNMKQRKDYFGVLAVDSKMICE